MEKNSESWDGLSPRTRCEVLLRWLSDFNLVAPHSSLSDLASGEAIAETLCLIDPDFFDPKWFKDISRGVPVDSMRLKRRNIQKIVSKIKDGFMERFNFHLVGYEYPREDAVLAADELEFSKLLQMVLTYAVYCEKQAVFIENIRKMEEFFQGAIMMAITDIQEHLEQLSYGQPASLRPNYPNTSLQLQKAHEEERDLYLMCEELKQSLLLAKEDNSKLVSERDLLSKKLDDLNQLVGGSPQSVPQLKQKIKELEDSLDKECSLKEALTREKEEMERSTRSMLKTNSRLSEEVRQLQDEVDVLREGREKLMILEKTVTNLSHTAEEVSSLRGVIKDLKTQLDELLKEKIRLEEDAKMVPRLQTELDRLAGENKKLEKQLEEEVDAGSRDRKDVKAFKMRLESLEKEKSALLADRAMLQEHVDELESRVSSGGLTETDPDTLELIPIAVREKMLRLEHEVKTKSVRLNTMESQLREVIEKEEKASRLCRELSLKMESMTMGEAGAGDDRSSEDQRNRIAYLEELLDKKTIEIQEMEERYKKYLEKAKVIIRSLDPKHSHPAGAGPGGSPPAPNSNSSNTASLSELNSLRLQLAQKDKTIMALEEEMAATRATKEMEERLMTTAFYNLGMQLDRQASERRMAAAETGATPVASLLARHRHSFRRSAGNMRPAGNQLPFVASNNNNAPSSG